MSEKSPVPAMMTKSSCLSRAANPDPAPRYMELSSRRRSEVIWVRTPRAKRSRLFVRKRSAEAVMMSSRPWRLRSMACRSRKERMPVVTAVKSFCAVSSDLFL
ncbi:hypothetical protein DSECCO2_386290 [anaerobic digester metagenome]